MRTIIRLIDRTTDEPLGFVCVENDDECAKWGISPEIDIDESWEEYSQMDVQEHGPEDVTEFVPWHNAQRVSELSVCIVTDSKIPGERRAE